jgi:signal transduction histidine kinase
VADWVSFGRGLSRPRTVRSQVTLLATAVVALVLAASAFGLVATQERVLTQGIDEALIQRADNIQGGIERGIFGSRLPNEGDSEDSFLMVVDAEGTVVESSPNAAGLPAPAAPADPGDPQVMVDVEDVSLSSGEFRVLVRPLGGAANGTLMVAKNLDDVDESVQTLTISLAVSIPVVTALLAGLVWWLTGRVLRPVEAIRREVSDIGPDELHRRVPTPGSDDEISRLADTMNQMLTRVEEATDRQRRFVADASHELRSPLTRLRSALEVAAAHPDDREAEAVFRELLADTGDLQKLVDDLLFLARSESGALTVPDEPVDLDDLVLAEARRVRERGTVRVDVAGVSAARTTGDAAQLRRAVRNLADNAERHAAGAVQLSLEETNGSCRLVVSDDGPGIAPEHREVVFKRFARLDEARSRDAGGAGLGLAIVQDIVLRHRGSVAIDGEDGVGTRVVVELPRVD